MARGHPRPAPRSRCPIYALNNKGAAVARLSMLPEELALQDPGVTSLQSALTTLTRSLELAPNDEFMRGVRNAAQARLDSLRDEG